MTVEPPRRGRPRSARADAAILDAAIDEIVEHGFASMTIDGIATRAGVARTTVYRRWSSLPTLCMEAIERIRERLPAAPGDSVHDDLVFLLTHVNRILTTTRFGQLLPQLAAEARRSPESARVYWTTYLARGRHGFAEVLHRGVREGAVAGDIDAELIIDMLLGPLVHRSLWQVETMTDQQIAYLVSTVLAGLRPSGAAPPAQGRVG